MNYINQATPIDQPQQLGNVVTLPGVAIAPAPVEAPPAVYTRSVIESACIKLNYQPQIELATGAIRGVEALLRPTTESGAALNTGDFVAAAEQQGLIGAIGERVLRLACAEFAALGGASGKFGRLAINVSPLELRRANFAECVVDAVTGAGLRYEDVELEITESWSLDDPSLRLDELIQLAELGITLAIDDFGSGYAVWSHVLKIPVNTLKIDRTLASQVTRNPSARAIVASICGACRELDLEVVGEGICNRAQRDELVSLGCTIGQGFGLSRPLTGPALADFTPPTGDCSVLHLVG